MTDAERRDLETEIRDLQVRIRLLRRHWRGASEMPEDAALTLANLEAELRELREQRRSLDEAPPLTLPTIREQLASVSWSVSELTSRIPGLERRVADLERKLGDWFEADKRDRQRGWVLANAYRLLVLGLVAVDIASRWLAK